jgi:carnosine synthase
MKQATPFRVGLAAADPARLRDRGPEGEALRRELLSLARVAVIEPGYITKRFLYVRAHSLGVKLVLVGTDAGWARTLVHEGVAERFLDADTSGRPEAGAHAILDALGDEAGRLDGIFTLWEDTVPATARVAEALGLPGMPPTAADGARSKLRTREASRDAGLPTPLFMHIPDASTLAAAAEHVGFPAVIKPVFGAEALGCLRVDDLPSLEEGYARVSALITPELNAIFRQGQDLLLEEYLDGPEFDVDIVLSDGECMFSAISENWPTEEPYFVETGMHSPSSHPVDRQDAMGDLCIHTAYALGFRDGVLHAEAKDTSNGPRLLEMNARLAGGIIEEIHRIVTGVSLLEQQVLLAVGLPAVPAPFPEPVAGATLISLHASRSGRLANTHFLDHLSTDPSVIQQDAMVEAGEPVTAAADGFPTVIAELAVAGPTADAAVTAGLAMVDALDIPYEP